MPESLVTTEELAARLPFVMSTDEEREALGALVDLSDEARYYGSDDWVSPEATPYPVKNLILKAATQHMKNYEGFTTTRAGDETTQWAERDELGQATFTLEQRNRLREYGGAHRPTLHTINTFAYQSRPALPRPEGLVPDSMDGSDPIPMFSHDDHPWW